MKPVLFTIPATFALLAALSPLAAAGTDPGETLFNQRCKMCHSLAADGSATPLAPNLRGVVGRKAASTAFKTYSPALKASNLTWTKANLDTFLAAPGKMVPGTKMVMSLTDAKQRSAVLGYLATQR